MSPTDPEPELRARNRRAARLLLLVMAGLAIATLLVGIRW
jgi:hypothetical protein